MIIAEVSVSVNLWFGEKAGSKIFTCLPKQQVLHSHKIFKPTIFDYLILIDIYFLKHF